MPTEKTKQAFLSFSQNDIEFVRHIIHRLTQNNIVVWNYAVDDERLPPGGDVKTELRHKMDERNLFIVIVTPNAMQSEYVRFELQYALSKRDAMEVIAFIDDKLHKLPLPNRGIFEPLFNLVHFPLSLQTTVVDGVSRRHLAAEAELEIQIKQLTALFQMDYQPPVSDLHRMPFMGKLFAELKHKTIEQRERENWGYSLMLDTAIRFLNACEQKNFPQAKSNIDYFLNMCVQFYPRQQFYYPYVAKLIVALEMDDLGTAETIANKLITMGAEDDNPYTALAVVHFRRGDFGKAAMYFEKALTICKDPAAEAGVLVSRLLNGETENAAAALGSITQLKVAAEADHRYMEGIRAFALLRSGQPTAAEKIYLALAQTSALTTPQVLNLAEALEQQQRIDAAIDVLRHALNDNNNDIYLRLHLAKFLFAAKRPEEAVNVLQETTTDSSIYYLSQAAQLCYFKGYQATATNLASATLSVEAKGPNSKQDFYDLGAANWILGRKERAEYDFERSGYPIKFHYKNVFI